MAPNLVCLQVLNSFGQQALGFFLKPKLQYLYLLIVLESFARRKTVLAHGKEAIVSSAGHTKLPFAFSMWLFTLLSPGLFCTDVVLPLEVTGQTKVLGQEQVRASQPCRA